MGNLNKKLTPRQHRTILALLENPTVQSAAASAGTSSASVYRWLADDTFKTAFREAKLEIVRSAMARLQRASGQAVDTLLALMADSDVPASVRLAAAKAAIEMVHKSLENEDLSERISALEKLISANVGASWRR